MMILAHNEHKYQASLTWLQRGAALLPCQPNSKFLLSGFGPVRNSIKHYKGAIKYFREKGCNLAVVLPDSMFCLDFEEQIIFQYWKNAVEPEYLLTRLEMTPHGYHVFYQGEIPAGVKLIPGVEIKRSCLVAPSVVAGVQYLDIRNDDILEVADTKSLLFPLLSEDRQPVRAEPVPVDQERARPAAGDDIISKIKCSVSIYEYAASLTQLIPSPAGQRRWWVGRCPLHHPDVHPSFWVDAERGLWGCHACDTGGDVLNLYSRVNGITNHEAIRRLSLGVAR